MAKVSASLNDEPARGREAEDKVEWKRAENDGNSFSLFPPLGRMGESFHGRTSVCYDWSIVAKQPLNKLCHEIYQNLNSGNYHQIE